MKIFEYENYREIIKSHISDKNRFGGEKITYQSFSQKLRIQKSYLSKILKGDADLSKDQAYLCTKEMNLNQEEADYLNLLLDYDRSALPELKKAISEKIQDIKIKNTQSDSYLSKGTPDNLTTSEAQKYYLSPEIQLIHLALGIKRYQKNPELLLREFSISDELLSNAIKILEELNLIEVKEHEIVLIKSNMHLDYSSPLFHQWQLQLKLKSIEQLKNLASKDKYNFLVTFSAEEKDKEKIRIEFLNFINKVEKIVKKSKPENLYQLNFDLLKWL